MYSYSTDFVLDAFCKAYETAEANYRAAAALKEKGLWGPATSLAVLALEEVGKMCLIDGLLFARGGDERHRAFTKGHRMHAAKLDRLELFPLFLDYLTTIDPRQKEEVYGQTMIAVLSDLKRRRQAVADLHGHPFLLGALDELKQKGFYSHNVGVSCFSNQEGIPQPLAEAIVALAWRVTGALQFVLGPNLDAYKQRVISLRSKMDDTKLAEIRKLVAADLETLFGPLQEQ
jgi:AbiV family abortive infection protein